MQTVARAEGPVRDPFISEDPIGFGGGDVNLYAYVLNNPVNLVDPTGLQHDSVSRSLQAAIRYGNTGEIRAVLDTAGDVLSPTARQAAQDALRRLETRAADIIAKELKGSVNAEFPSELRNKTLEEILRLARQGDKAAQKARKLLTDKTYCK